MGASGGDDCVGLSKEQRPSVPLGNVRGVTPHRGLSVTQINLLYKLRAEYGLEERLQSVSSRGGGEMGECALWG